jgi:hypothetical protein
MIGFHIESLPFTRRLLLISGRTFWPLLFSFARMRNKIFRVTLTRSGVAVASRWLAQSQRRLAVGWQSDKFRPQNRRLQFWRAPAETMKNEAKRYVIFTLGF